MKTLMKKLGKQIKKAVKNTMEINIGDNDSHIQIGNRSFKGNNVSIVGRTVIIDGVKQDDLVIKQGHVINVEVHGNVESITSGSGDVIAQNVGNLTTGSGEVKCHTVSGNVRTSSGEIECSDIMGDVETSSGDVSCDAIAGSVTTSSGDVDCDGGVGGSVKTRSGDISHRK
jgi:hypothetical protein